MSPVAPLCLITGASTGIGAELAREFAKTGHALVLTARRETQLSALADDIAAQGYARPAVIAADLATPAGVAELAEALAARGLEPAIVVNNAGFGLIGEAAELDRDRQLAMINLNIRALTELTLRFLDSVKRQRGGILNVASVAGFLPGPGMAVYHATKAYVLSLTEALHGELAAEGVRVCALCPGPVETTLRTKYPKSKNPETLPEADFLDQAGIPQDYFPSFFVRSVERVAREGYAGFMGGHRVVVTGTPNRITTLLPRLLPRALMLAITTRRWQRASRGS